MKIEQLGEPLAVSIVPPITLVVTFETEKEMRDARVLLGPLPMAEFTDRIYDLLGGHLDKFSKNGRRKQ